MRAVHSVVIAAALAATLPASAQTVRVEDRLTAAEFRAAGLDKLSDAELAQLNELLGRNPAPSTAAPPATELEARLAEAREAGRQEARTEDRGLSAPTSREPITSTIVGRFQGFARGREYTLANGQVWRQIDAASISGASGQDVGARIRPGFMGVWWLKIDGYNTQAKVERIR